MVWCLYSYLVHVSVPQVGKGKRWGGGRGERGLYKIVCSSVYFLRLRSGGLFEVFNSPHLLMFKLSTLNMTPVHGLYVSFGDYLQLFSLFLVEMRIFS
jgi:hypothetical protein